MSLWEASSYFREPPPPKYEAKRTWEGRRKKGKWWNDERGGDEGKQERGKGRRKEMRKEREKINPPFGFK